MDNFLVELADVSKRYGHSPALAGVSLAVACGAHLAILGPSGGGKSTLLRLLAGLEEPTSGTISIGGEVVSRPGSVIIPPLRRRLSLVFQDLALWPNLTAEGNVRLGLSGTKLPRRERMRRAREMLQMCGIDHLARRFPAQLSGGEQQRVALARALAPQPALLLFDEPFANLDLMTKRRLLCDLETYAATCRATVILVTHDPADARAICRRVAILEAGRVVAQGDAAHLREPSQIASNAPFASLLGDYS